MDLERFAKDKLIPLIPLHSSPAAEVFEIVSSPTTMASRPNHKRPNDSATPEYTPSKRTCSTLGFDSSMKPIRRTASGVVIPLAQGITLADDVDEFEDALEQQADLGDDPEGKGLQNGMPEKSASGMNGIQQYHVEEDADDLFTTTFGAGDHERASDDDGEDDVVGNAKGPSKTDRLKTPAKNDHEDGCHQNRGVSTPPESPAIEGKKGSASASNAGKDANSKPSQSAVKARPSPQIIEKEPRPDKDEWRPRKLHRKLHERAKACKPQLKLAEHRYLIAVASPERDAAKCKDEKHFVWMKGNRMTTVQTVWHEYRTAALIENFVLLLGNVERVSFADQVQDLDYFNDKLILFRAVDPRHPEAKGRSIDEGIVPSGEVIELE
ncbi:hypothetical protein KC332_g16152 [Hortaea werneckii]|nr:hypothetical protein KC350_g15724 [Hortaea werneckii]KAI6804930.1 hypothetical protein KC358_g14560 [Hortaea werneckii]KAI6905883.1 hypothetical protein KC348_g14851 [Hortaea werneckii]KAI6924025.1 hypothetical protein KC341_g14310 [Hortaea werneckii]KAI6957675.1 hypothetical protein KC321_g14459 [Hortaea werneckii]